MIDGSDELKKTFIPVDILSFRNAIRDITFDVFLRISDENMAHVFSKSTGLDYKRLAQYIQKGVSELFIRAEDEELYKTFIARSAEAIFNDPQTPPEKKIATLLNMTEQNMAELFTHVNVAEDTAVKSQKVIKSYVKLMIENPKTLAVLLKLVSHGEYLYYHSIAVAIFSMFIAKASGQFNQRTLEIVGLGGFLHDIGCTQMKEQIDEHKPDLTTEEKQALFSHPKLGLTMIEATSNLPDEVRYIVYQHHEEPGGEGYPNRLRSPVIYYPAKIVALADCFSALISRRPYRPAYSVEEAIAQLQNEPEKHDRELLKILGTVFASQAGRKAA